MATTTLNASSRPPERDNLLLQLALGWHVLLTVGCIAGAVTLWTAVSDDTFALWVRILVTAVLVFFAVLSGTAVPLILRRQHRGRVISLFVNYLGAMIALFGCLHLFGVFVGGLNAMADNFARGIPFLALIFVGIGLRSVGRDRLNEPLERAGQALTWLALAVFLFMVGILDGLQSVLGTLTNLVPFLFLIALVVCTLMIWIMWRAPAAEAFKATNAHAEMLNGYLFLSPNLLGFLVFFAGPLLLSLYFSFTNYDAFGGAEWIGLQNYREILNLTIASLSAPDQLAREVIDVQMFSELNRFTIFGNSYVIGAQDRLFWIALGNTLRYVVIVVPLCVLPALVLANLLNTKIPGVSFFRAAYFLPSVAAVVGIALVWQWLYNSTVGYVNYFITLSIDAINGLGLAQVMDPQIRWLSDADTALFAVAIMGAWQLIGFNTVLFLAGLQSIPHTLYEAATVDGANTYNKFRHVTLPMLAPTTFFVVITTVIRTMQVFEEVFILIPGQNPAGPNNSTLTMVLYLYQKGFQRFEQGYASAIAWVLFLLIFGATLFQFQRQRSGGGAYD